MKPLPKILTELLKDAVRVGAGILMSWMMLGWGQWALLQVIPLRGTPEAKFLAMEKQLWVDQIVLLPMISAAVGVFMGLCARRRAWLLTVISLAPLMLFFFKLHLTVDLWLVLRGGGVVVVYLAVGSIVALGVRRWKHKRPDPRQG